MEDVLAFLSNETLWTVIAIVVAVVVGLLLLIFLFILIIWAVYFAVDLFRWAAEQGFIGVAVYIACWVFFLPVMAGICLVGAVVVWIKDRTAERAWQAEWQAKLPSLSNTVELSKVQL